MNMNHPEITCAKIIDQIGTVFVSEKRETLEKVLCGFLAGGHILFEDNPGLGKTLLVKLFARVTGCSWKRVQFTPDLMPADIIGTKIWKGSDAGFELEKGPVFTNFLLADEINRALPKTQSALLEAMEERQVTIEGTTYKLTPPFTVMATQNPIEMEGTYPLPEAQMDRFIMRLSLGYAGTANEECEILKRRISWKKDDPVGDLAEVISQEELIILQREVEDVYVDENILKYIAEIVTATRKKTGVLVGASPRGSLALLKLVRAWAMIHGRDFVIPDDVKMLAVDALAHRIILDMENVLEGLKPEDKINEVISNTEVPKEYTRKAL
ncbi:MAG: MoxR family ATPase [Clostridia bacterium]|nr:MoxR family ATPase [Clostridia bacterium]